VVQPSTGDVLAVANAGRDGAGPTGPHRPLPARVDFKVASDLALLRQGLTPTEPVALPATVAVEGKSFKNAEGECSQPAVPPTSRSSATPPSSAAPTGHSAQLQQAARDLGYVELDLGVGAAGATSRWTDDAVQHAAQVLGQGKVLASPLSVAVSAAAVADGRLRPPRC
jgi:hypothetical protein